MTTNQTIDGVPRADLQAAYDELTDWKSPVAQKLRALLDAPAKKRPAWMDEPFAVAARGERAAQPQGEPVGFRYRAHGAPWELMDESPFADGRTHHRENGEELQPVYADQPAPVAVVMPERKQYTSHVDTSNFKDGWNACLDEVSRLNTK